jgi:hypothetical protein
MTTNKALHTKPETTKLTSVATQHRSENGVKKYAKLTTDQLHQQTLGARHVLFGMCVGAAAYATDVLVPYCEEIIARYKMPGVGAKDRPNGKPTVKAYFRSINLNYNTVRSWIHRKKLSTDMFGPESTTSTHKGGTVLPRLTLLEAKLLGTASAGHDIVKAFKQGGNLDEVIRDFVKCAPTPERIEEYIERPVKVVATEVEKLAVRLCKLIDKNEDKNGEKILTLARELLSKAEPTTVELVLADEKKRPQGDGITKPAARRAA